MHRNHPHSCRCAHHSRRSFLRLVGAGAGASLLGVAGPSMAAGHCEALLLNCMDHRLQDETSAWMDKLGLSDDYDHVVLAGASLAAITPKRPAWGVTFRQHLATSIKLHSIKRVIALDHRDCSAYRLFLGEAAVRDPHTEFETHAAVLRKLRDSIHRAHPNLAVELGLMSLDGSVETVS